MPEPSDVLTRQRRRGPPVQVSDATLVETLRRAELANVTIRS